jgi:hypothetical protein
MTSKSLPVSYTINRCLLTMVRTHDRALSEIFSSSDTSEWELYVEYIKSLEQLIATGPRNSPCGITLQCASILHTCGLIMGKYNKTLPDGRTANGMDEAIFLHLQSDIQKLATGEPMKRKVMCVSCNFASMFMANVQQLIGFSFS